MRSEIYGYINQNQKKRYNVLWIFVLVYYILTLKLFYLVELPMAYGVGEQFLNTTFLILAVISIFFINKSIRIDSYGRWVLIYLFFIIFEFISSLMRYPDEPGTLLIKYNLYLLTPIGYYLFSPMIRMEKDFERVFDICALFSLIAGFLLTVNAFCYNEFRLMFLKIGGVNYGSVKLLFRQNGIRIYNLSQGFIMVSGLISFGTVLANNQKGLNNKGKWFWVHLFNFLMMFLLVYYVEQSRMSLLICAGSALFILLFSGRGKGAKRLLTFIIIISVASVLFGDIISGTTRSLLTSLSDVNDITAYNRIDGMLYYLEYSLSHPILGIGLASSGGAYGHIVAGPFGRWNFTDDGIIGIIGKLGYVGGLLYLFIIIKMTLDAFKSKHNTRGTQIGLCINLILSCFTLSYLDSQRIVGFLLTIVYISTCKKQNMTVNKKSIRSGAKM